MYGLVGTLAILHGKSSKNTERKIKRMTKRKKEKLFRDDDWNEKNKTEK